LEIKTGHFWSVLIPLLPLIENIFIIFELLWRQCFAQILIICWFELTSMFCPNPHHLLIRMTNIKIVIKPLSILSPFLTSLSLSLFHYHYLSFLSLPNTSFFSSIESSFLFSSSFCLFYLSRLPIYILSEFCPLSVAFSYFLFSISTIFFILDYLTLSGLSMLFS